MSWVAPLLLIFSLTMACLTDPQGFAVWIAKDQVTEVTRNIDGPAQAKSRVTTSSGSVYVLEAPADVIKKLNGDKP